MIDLTIGHTVWTDIPEHFVFTYRRGSFKLTHQLVKIEPPFCDYLAGRYIVVKTCCAEGGTGHGPHDTFAGGHHVFAEHVGGVIKVDFYQSGDFAGVIKDIKPVGTARRKWVLDPALLDNSST